jgi:DNA-binding CsgD family transcriptional regulator
LAAVERGRQLHADAFVTIELGLDKEGRLGPEGQAWLARVDAEWARLRWLTDAEPPTADEHLELWQRTVELFSGELYERARSQIRLAEVLRAAGRHDAAQFADEAMAVARRLGARPLIDELQSLNLARASQPVGAPGSEALTPRESEVLDLLVQGRTNRQIAKQLYISEKTVSVHVSNLLAKLGVRSRAEAAALVRRAE